jgi:2-iminobutanoate/2-iminopropanoate deaminase
MEKIETADAPRAIGPYSQAIVCPSTASLIFVSGQLPIDPKTNQLVEGEIGELTRQVLNNIKAILIAAGSDFDKVVRVDVFLKDLKKDFRGMNEEYARHFTHPLAPARQTVQVANLPLNSPIEISCVAIR